MNFLDIDFATPTQLPKVGETVERYHQFDPLSVRAVNAAIAAGRPLLVRGEPGVGKTQLPEAVAKELGYAFVSCTVDSRTESRDLLWKFDAVLRLAEAQLCHALGGTSGAEPEIRERLAEKNFVHPGPLWWAFHWKSAQEVCTANRRPAEGVRNLDSAPNGWVVLIDEIDKAETDVPNGLLEALGSGQFSPPGYPDPIHMQKSPRLIVITTNEERSLPDAFLRRCLVLHLELPRTKEKLIQHLVARGHAHFGSQTDDDVLQEAASQLVEDRAMADEEQLRPLPGQAEYLDLVRAVIHQKPGSFDEQKELLGELRRFVFRKHAAMQ